VKLNAAVLKNLNQVQLSNLILLASERMITEHCPKDMNIITVYNNEYPVIVEIEKKAIVKLTVDPIKK